MNKKRCDLLGGVTAIFIARQEPHMCGPRHFCLQHFVKQRQQNLYILAKLRVKFITE